LSSERTLYDFADLSRMSFVKSQCFVFQLREESGGSAPPSPISSETSLSTDRAALELAACRTVASGDRSHPNCRGSAASFRGCRRQRGRSRRARANSRVDEAFEVAQARRIIWRDQTFARDDLKRPFLDRNIWSVEAAGRERLLCFAPAFAALPRLRDGSVGRSLADEAAKPSADLLASRANGSLSPPVSIRALNDVSIVASRSSGIGSCGRGSGHGGARRRWWRSEDGARRCGH